MTGNSTMQPVTAVAQIVYSGDENWVSQFSRGFTIADSTEADFQDVLTNDASLAFNLTMMRGGKLGSLGIP
jgi:hypothetical protein